MSRSCCSHSHIPFPQKYARHFEALSHHLFRSKTIRGTIIYRRARGGRPRRSPRHSVELPLTVEIVAVHGWQQEKEREQARLTKWREISLSGDNDN